MQNFVGNCYVTPAGKKKSDLQSGSDRKSRARWRSKFPDSRSGPTRFRRGSASSSSGSDRLSSGSASSRNKSPASRSGPTHSRSRSGSASSSSGSNRLNSGSRSKSPASLNGSTHSRSRSGSASSSIGSDRIRSGSARSRSKSPVSLNGPTHSRSRRGSSSSSSGSDRPISGSSRTRSKFPVSRKGPTRSRSRGGSASSYSESDHLRKGSARSRSKSPASRGGPTHSRSRSGSASSSSGSDRLSRGSVHSRCELPDSRSGRTRSRSRSKSASSSSGSDRIRSGSARSRSKSPASRNASPQVRSRSGSASSSSGSERSSGGSVRLGKGSIRSSTGSEYSGAGSQRSHHGSSHSREGSVSSRKVSSRSRHGSARSSNVSESSSSETTVVKSRFPKSSSSFEYLPGGSTFSRSRHRTAHVPFNSEADHSRTIHSPNGSTHSSSGSGHSNESNLSRKSRISQSAARKRISITSDDETKSLSKRPNIIDDCDSNDDEKRNGNFISDFDRMLLHKKAGKARRRKGDIEFINDNDDLIDQLIYDMKLAAEADRQLNMAGKPATKKLSMLNHVKSQLIKKNLQLAFLEHNVLDVLTQWLAPMPNKSLPCLPIRESILKILLDLPEFDKNLLKQSGVGKAVMYLYKHPEEIKTNRVRAEQLIYKWARPIYNVSSDFSALSKEERQKRDLAQVAYHQRKTASGTSSFKAPPKKPIKEKVINPGEPGWVPRARVPQPSNTNYVVRPKSNVVHSKPFSKKIALNRYEKCVNKIQNRKRAMQSYKTVKLSIEGRNLPL